MAQPWVIWRQAIQEYEQGIPVTAATVASHYTNSSTNTNPGAGVHSNADTAGISSSPESSIRLQHHYPSTKQWTARPQDIPTYPTSYSNPNSTRDNSPVVSTFLRRSPENTSGSIIEDIDDDGFEGQERAVRRFSGACRHCKKVKTKCEFIVEYNMCRRCRIKDRPCIFEGRKKTEHKHEILIAQIRDKDATIDALLNKIKSRGIIQEDSTNCHYTDSDVDYDTPPNIETQTWIHKLYERYPPDANNDWTVPSMELQQWDGLKDEEEKEKEKEEKDAFRRVGVSRGVESCPSTRSVENTVDDKEFEEYIEGSLSPLHPILLHHLPAMPTPIAYLVDLRRRHMHTHTLYDAKKDVDCDDENENEFGIAHPKYFHPGPAIDIDQRRFYIEREPVPDILMHGLITLDDVDALFKIYFERMNAFISLLDPVLHTPSNTFNRCPFLFMTICAIASRYYPPKRSIYKYAMHFAKVQAGSHLVNGWKTVELCQAYLLLSTFSMPAKKWEEDRSRLYLELAIRIALDLNLHQQLSPSHLPTEKYERESLNRTRAWLNCYNLDCSMSTLLGRPAMLSHGLVSEDMAEWYKRSKYNHPYDVHLCAYTEALRLMCQFHEAVRGPGDMKGKKDLRFYKRVTLNFSDQLDDVHAGIAERYDRDSDKNDSGCVFRTGLLPLIINYYRLVMFSFGFQEAVDQGSLQKGDIFFQNCFDAACGVVTSMIDILAPMGYIRFSPDGYIVFTAFAAAFLLKLLRPDFAKIVKRAHKDQISFLVRKLIRFLGSAEVAVDERHTPKLYSRFLAELVARMFSANPLKGKGVTPGCSGAGGVGAAGAGSSREKREGEQQDRNAAAVDAVVGSNERKESQSQGNQGIVETGLRSSNPSENSALGVPVDQGVQYLLEEVHPANVQIAHQQYDYSKSDSALVPENQYHAQSQQQQQQPQQEPQPTHFQDESASAPAAGSSITWPPNYNVGTDAYMFDDTTMSLPALTTEEYILSMQAINNPRWWENVMMPGFSWPVHPTSAGLSAGQGASGGGMAAPMEFQYPQQQQHEYEYDAQGQTLDLGQGYHPERRLDFQGQGHHDGVGGEGTGEQQIHYGVQYPSEDSYEQGDYHQEQYQFVGQASFH